MRMRRPLNDVISAACLSVAMSVPQLLAAQPASDGYARAVTLYRAGATQEAILAFSKLDRGTAQVAARALVKQRGNAGRPTLLAAALLHLDASLGSRPGPRAADFDAQVDLARQLINAADDLAPRRDGPRGALLLSRAVAFFMLDDVSGRDAREYAEQALVTFRDDGPLLLAAGAACETQGTGRWDIYSPNGRRTVRALSHNYLLHARKFLQRAIDLLPDPAEAEMHLAHIEILDNDDRAADDRLTQLLARNPAPIWKYLALLQQSEIHLRAGEGQASLAKVNGALDIFPAAPSGLTTLSALLYQAGDRQGAARTADRLFAAQAAPDAADPWWDYRFGHWKTAEQWLAPLRTEVRQ
jgi:tetratricopeptide (TPR) repeat protein